MRFGRDLKVLVCAIVLAAVAACVLGSAPDDPDHSLWLRLIVVHSGEEAERLLNQLRHGADFAVLARETSVDATAVDGGYLGKVDPASLRPELREALKGLQPGQTTGVVRIPSGYAIVRVLLETEVPTVSPTGRARQAQVLALGSVHVVFEVDGFGEATATVAQMSKPEGWEQSPQSICEVYSRAYADSLKYANEMLDPTSPHSLAQSANATPQQIVQAHFTLGQLYVYTGEMAKATEQFETANRMAGGDPQVALVLEEALGIAYLHKSEMDNDVYKNPGDRCLFPMPRGMRYAQPAASEAAIAHFLKYLEQKPDELDVKWLLNIASMTVGGYPDSVPAKFRIPSEVFASSETAPRFTDVARETGLNPFAMASGVVVDDFDNDGLLDVVTSTYDTCGPMRCYHNNGDGTFTDRAVQAHLANQLGGLNLVATDYNNDGCLDLLVLRGAWQNLGQRKSLLRNNCDGTFTDVTKESGLGLRATNTQSAVWADIDNDGFVDLFVVNEQGPSELYRNRGDGTFEDISASSGINRSAFSKGVAAADYDGDGYVDFFVSNMSGPGYLYHNNHDGTFTEIAAEAGVGTARSFATWFFDYDNDGWPDLFVTSFYPSLDEIARTYLNLPHNATTLKLYRNLGNGTFRDVTKETGLDKVYMPMGSNFGDIDNDGYLDIYLGTGNPSYASLVPNVLLRNKEGKSFVDVTASSGTGELHKGHGVAFGDLDNDGDEDILAAIGGAVPGDRHVFRVFENPGNSNDWVCLKLVGTKANRAAVGAKIKVTVRNEGRTTRSIYRTVGFQSSFGGSPLRQHIGLGKSAEILNVEIRWPGSPVPQTFSKVGKNQFLEIKEGSASITKLNLHPFRLGGANRAGPAQPKKTTGSGN
jgi:tetratricopeptide (TPR) repeat protein